MNRNDIASSYREAAVRGAGQVELAVMLYDILLDDMQRAIAAIHARDIETRTSEIKHALSVLEHLQGTLNFDQGGEAARNMDRLYSIVRAKLLEAHIKTSAEILQKQIDLLVPVREAWKQVSPSPAKAAEYPPPPQADEPTGTEWRI
ncbi:MAG TPA: flagellar export chaperone FliS [Terriglobales bacterium]|nr:flagellar export chaperone FliS [Terriglobales bacterium]